MGRRQREQTSAGTEADVFLDPLNTKKLPRKPSGCGGQLITEVLLLPRREGTARSGG